MPLLMPGFSNINDAAIAELARANYTLMLIGVVFFAPLCEEMLYRGLIFRELLPHSKVAAYLVSMAAFAAIHVLGYIGSADVARLVLCFIQYLPAGLCLGWAYERTGTILTPIIIHACVNALGVYTMRLA
jgi:membrane protease YdiL (CAAX protease family)